MAGVLLAAFPVLLLFNTRLAAVALVVAIVLLYRKRANTTRHPVHRHVEEDY